MKSIPDKLYFKIGEVSEITGVKPYVLRYWETEFNIIEPVKAKSKHRLYRKKDIESVLMIKKLLYEDKLTIAGARKKLAELTDARKNISTETQGPDLKKIVAELTEIRDFLSQ
jgi:DNA-binding transcriptional MerR regulator